MERLRGRAVLGCAVAGSRDGRLQLHDEGQAALGRIRNLEWRRRLQLGRQEGRRLRKSRGRQSVGDCFPVMVYLLNLLLD